MFWFIVLHIYWARNGRAVLLVSENLKGLYKPFELFIWITGIPFFSALFTGRQVGSAITLAGAQMTIQAVHQAIQMQQQAQVAQMMQSQYMPYSQLPVQIVHYDVYPAGLSRY